MLLPRTGTQHFLLDTYQAKGECEILGGEPEKILATAHPVLGDARLPKLMRQKPASVQFSKKCAERRQLSCSPLPRYHCRPSDSLRQYSHDLGSLSASHPLVPKLPIVTG